MTAAEPPSVPRNDAGEATLVISGIGSLVTCDPQRGEAPGVVADAILMASGRTILYAGPRVGAPSLVAARDITHVDAQGAAVVPGFVDGHTHITWLGDRSDEYAQRAAGQSYEEIAAAGGGIRATVRATAAGTAMEIRDAAAGRARRMLGYGTTTVEVKSGYGLDHDAEMRQLEAAAGLRGEEELPDVVITYLPLHALPDVDRAAHVEQVCRRGIPQAAATAAFCDVFCDAGAYSVEECARVLGAARDARMGVKVHAEQRSHSGGAQLAARLAAVSADHLEHANDADIAALAAAGVVAVLLPGAALTLGGPSPPGRRMIDAGVTVAIASDCNPGTCYSESMPLMMSLAVANAGLTPAEALVAATRGGAAALALPDRGVLRAGNRCDALVLDSARWIDVAYHLGANPVATVISGGRVCAPAMAPPRA